jgi:hypothetical protein
MPNGQGLQIACQRFIQFVDFGGVVDFLISGHKLSPSRLLSAGT